MSRIHKKNNKHPTCSRDTTPSLNSTFCPINIVLSSSSSSSSSNPDLAAPGLIDPNAAFPPASENGVLCTAVPNTLAFFDTPKVAKSLITLRTLSGDDEGDEGDEGGECV